MKKPQKVVLKNPKEGNSMRTKTSKRKTVVNTAIKLIQLFTPVPDGKAPHLLRGRIFEMVMQNGKILMIVGTDDNPQSRNSIEINVNGYRTKVCDLSVPNLEVLAEVLGKEFNTLNQARIKEEAEAAKTAEAEKLQLKRVRDKQIFELNRKIAMHLA